MKTLMMKQDGEWIEIKKPQLTKEESETLSGYSQKTKEVKDFKNYPKPTAKEQAVIDKMNKERFGELTKKDKTAAEKLYNEVKPELKEEDKYQLLSFTIHYKEDKPFGILNCRINGEHKQIRF